MTPQIHLPEKLIPIFQGNADVRGAYGGRGSGKTVSFATMTAVQALRFWKAGAHGVILCGRQWQNSIQDSSHAEIRFAIESDPFLNKCFDIGDSYIRTKDGRINYVFRGLSRNLSSIKGIGKILLAWLDEAEDVSDEAFTILLPTIREEGSELWITWNPGSKRSAVHKRFRLPNDPLIKIVEMNWRDNPKFPEKLNRERLRDLKDRPEDYDWIWEGGFRSFTSGAVWGKELLAAKNNGQICRVPHVPGVHVYTAWDIGRSDATAIWFWQFIGGEVRIIDYLCASFKTPDWFVSQMLGQEISIDIEQDQIKVKKGKVIDEAQHRKEYDYGTLWLPHDAFAKTFAAKGKSVQEQLAAVFGWGLIQKVPSLSVDDGIKAARKIISKCYWDEPLEGEEDSGFDALCAYRYDWSDDRGKYSDKPKHDWASNPADAFRYLAICAQEKRPEPKPEPFNPKTEIRAQDLLDEHFRKMKKLRNN